MSKDTEPCATTAFPGRYNVAQGVSEIEHRLEESSFSDNSVGVRAMGCLILASRAEFRSREH